MTDDVVPAYTIIVSLVCAGEAGEELIDIDTDILTMPPAWAGSWPAFAAAEIAEWEQDVLTGAPDLPPSVGRCYAVQLRVLDPRGREVAQERRTVSRPR